MIRLILKGGLGNQMFQYAAAYRIAKRFNHRLILDTTFLDTNIPLSHFTKRKYELHIFDVKEDVKSFASNRFLNAYFGYLFHSLVVLSTNNRLIEDNYLLNSISSEAALNIEVLKQLTNEVEVRMEGFFHDIAYFEDYKSDILEIFNITKLFDPAFNEIEDKIATSNSVSINIRRGDYENKKNKDIYITLDEAYYTQAIVKIRNQVENPHFFIFSYDFPQGLDRPFGLKEQEYTLLGKEFTGKFFKTYLRLIALCKHNIISNSTFSFWGGYLNQNDASNVIAPSRWEHKKNGFNYPKNWHIIPV